MRKLSVFILLMVLVNLSSTDVTTVVVEGESVIDVTTKEAEAAKEIDETTVSDYTEQQNETNESFSNIEANTTPVAGQEIAEETTTDSAIAPQTTVAESDPVCVETGVIANHMDCHLYYEWCNPEGSDGSSLRVRLKSCPEGEAVNREETGCSRDISSCRLDISCVSKGTIADPKSNSHFYVCQPRFSGSGFYVFHVSCNENEFYEQAFGRCLNKNRLPSLHENISDIDKVTNEIKKLKKEYKLALKKARQDEKLRKEQEKLKKQEAKKEAKLLKEQEKLRKKAQKDEAATFICETEGNFPSQLGDNIYIACVKNKKKVIAVPMECNLDAKFDPQFGLCLTSSSMEGSGSDGQ